MVKQFREKRLRELIQKLDEGEYINYEDFARYKRSILTKFLHEKEYIIQEMVGNALVIVRLDNDITEDDNAGMETGNTLVSYVTEVLNIACSN